MPERDGKEIAAGPTAGRAYDGPICRDRVPRACPRAHQRAPVSRPHQVDLDEVYATVEQLRALLAKRLHPSRTLVGGADEFDDRDELPALIEHSNEPFDDRIEVHDDLVRRLDENTAVLLRRIGSRG